ncbi:MAG: two-component sensor histidine kinase, partial [Spirochaetes bacterium]|nr:two-component sensor histidine kinase [Spirochaetota bacterium]
SRLLHDLQELSSAEAGTSRIEYSTLALDELARTVLDDFRTAAAERQLQLAFVHDPALELPCLIEADRQLLLRILNNLLSNALTAGNPGGYVRLELHPVAQTAAKTADCIELLCVDNGAGIPEAEREKIFERFYRVDSSRNRQSGGSGLGLAISRELARLHGGSLSAEANPEGKGSVFRLILPRKQAQT